ncbi:unnamed protein product, partial [Effrenium voratum]
SFSSSSPYDKRVKTQLIADVFTLVGLVPHDHDAVEKTCKEEQAKRLQGALWFSFWSFGFAVSTIKSAPLKSLGEAEWRLILEAHEENMRRGNLTRIYPREAGPYDSFAEIRARYSNLVLERWIELGGEHWPQPARHGVKGEDQKASLTNAQHRAAQSHKAACDMDSQPSGSLLSLSLLWALIPKAYATPAPMDPASCKMQGAPESVLGPQVFFFALSSTLPGFAVCFCLRQVFSLPGLHLKALKAS